MERKPVQSSNIDSIGYDKETEILEIEFNNRRVYQYFNVPINVYIELMNAPSHGKYFNQNIKNDYTCNQVK